MSLRSELRDAFRQWVRTPGVSVAALTSLALGIGASISIFSLFNALLLKPLHVRQPDRVVTFHDDRSPDLPALRLSHEMFLSLARENTVLEGVAAYATQQINVASRGEPVRNARGLFVSGSYFPLLGVPAVAGRLLNPPDDNRAAPTPVLVISEAYWRARFGSDPGVIGRSIDVVHKPFTIVGVVDGGFLGLDPGQGFDIALPIGVYQFLYGDGRLMMPQAFWLTGFGRLRPGHSLAESDAGMRALQLTVIDQIGLPKNIADVISKPSWRLRPAAASLAGARTTYQRPLLILLGLVLIVLAQACVNVAHLLVARVSSRRGELAIRLSLGASRLTLMRQLTWEVLLLVLAGTLAGLMIGAGGARFLTWLLSTSRNPIQLDLTIDWRVLVFAALAATITAAVAVLVPAVRVLAVDPGATIQAYSRRIVGPRKRIDAPHLLVAVQIAMTFLLVVCGATFAASFIRLTGQDFGFDRGRIQLVGVLGPPQTIAVSRLVLPLQERLLAVPGVTDVAFSLASPFGTTTFITYASVAGPQVRQSWPQEFHTYENIVSGNYFAAMGMRLVAGRGFGESSERPDVVVVNEAFARKFFGGAALGRTVWEGLEQAPKEIVGVVADNKQRSLREAPPPMLYGPWNSESRVSTFVRFSVRSGETTPSPMALTQAVDRLVPGAGVDIRSLDTEIADTVVTERATMALAMLFGGFALLLAAVGIYGVLSSDVYARLPELAIRVAVGASPNRVRGLVLSRVMAAVSTGILGGIALVVAGDRAVEALLYEVRPSNLALLASAGAVLTVVSAAAVLNPARRATNVDPAVLLRAE